VVISKDELKSLMIGISFQDLEQHFEHIF